MYQRILTGAALLGCSVTDLKCRKVYKPAAAGYLVLAALGHLAGRTATPAQMAFGLLPGIFCLAVSWLSRQGLGYGDSVLALGCGLSLGFWPCMEALFFAFFLSGLWAAILLVLRKAGRKKEFPFVPFLLAGALIQWAGGV